MASHVNSQTPSVAGSINNHDQIYNPLLEFKAGVTACLASWSALRTAAESGWGGGERVSQQKAEDLRTHIFEKFDGRKCPLPNYDAFDLADDLAIYIEEEFSVTLEDDSECQLAEAVFQMYERCLNGDPTLARQMVAQAAGAVELNSQFPVRVQTTEHDDDDDEMEGAESATMVAATNHAGTMESPQQQLPYTEMIPTNLVDYVSQPLFGKSIEKKVGSTEPMRQLGERVEDRGVVEMDEDGFAPVTKGNRRR
jgi:hypothetical protein